MMTRYLYPIFVVLLSTLTMVGCDQPPDDSPAKSVEKKTETAENASTDNDSANRLIDAGEMVSATQLTFQESEAGIEPYITRMLITDAYIRIDEADSQEGYVIFDRQHRRIYSVLHESEKILVVDPSESKIVTPDNLKLTDKILADDNAPAVGGVKPKHYQFYANDTLCYDVVAINGLLPEVTTVLLDYQKVLAAQQKKTIALTPPELQTPCYLANYVYAASSYMSKGFPFEQWSVDGYRRSLVEFKEGKKVDKILFALPEGYGFFSLGGAGGGTIM